MDIADGKELRAQLEVLCKSSKRIHLAVAFWGDGALDAFGLRAHCAETKIVCNLCMGGTNPRVIRELIDCGASVRHSDVLHAKLYVFDLAAALGSSNASANGLSWQGDEVDGWTEANVVSGDPDFVREAEAVFDRVWTSARVVTEADLKGAKLVWDRRRRAAARGTKIAGSTLLDALKSTPSKLADVGLYLAVDSGHVSAAGEAAIEAERNETSAGDDLDAWEDWPEMPDGATFVCFHRGPKGGLSFEGFWHAPERRRTRKTADGTTVYFVERVRDVLGLAQPGSLADWREPITRALTDAADPGNVSIEFGELARRYL